MSVAAPSVTETRSAAGPVSLWATGLVGGLYVLAALAVVFYAVPNLWQMGVATWLTPMFNSFMNASLRIVAQFAAAVGLIIFGLTLAGPNPPKGIRGSIFLGISTLFTAFFLLRALLMIGDRIANQKFEVGYLFSLAFVGALAFLFVKFLASDRMPRWSIALESAGWFDVGQYKKNQGLRVRRLTILGLIILLGSGVYTMLHNNLLPAGDWKIAMPFSQPLMLLPDARLSVPLILGAAIIWLSWRVVNYPMFADFLIATEAEINKVSWTPRARLIQDTIVVLITVFIITLFLFLIDIFWGWLLSRELVNVLPSDAETQGSKNNRVVNKSEF
jgi:preprotein translocase SecE subunit